MKQRLLFIFSLWAGMLMNSSASAQADSLNNSGLGIIIDYGKLLTYTTDFESKLALGLSYTHKSNLSLMLTAGIAELNPKTAYENGEFYAKGMFGTAGINYLLPIDQTNSLYIGGAYGVSKYEDKYTYAIGSSIWPDFEQSVSHKDLMASWASLVIGSEHKMKIKHLTLGGNFQLRYLLEYDEQSPIDTYAIPGYGRTTDNTVPAINLYIKFTF